MSPIGTCSPLASELLRPQKGRYRQENPRSTQRVGSPKQLQQHHLLPLPRKSQVDKAAPTPFVVKISSHSCVIRISTYQVRRYIVLACWYRARMQLCSSLAILSEDQHEQGNDVDKNLVVRRLRTANNVSFPPPAVYGSRSTPTS
jgi:hypothetical protein